MKSKDSLDELIDSEKNNNLDSSRANSDHAEELEKSLGEPVPIS
jgi:hypothetical protein